jgi:N-methylhydantoinase A
LLRPLPQIVPRQRIVEVRERIDKNGRVVLALNEDAVADALRRLVEEHAIDALAVSFLWSFVDPSHERAVAEIAGRLYPDLPVSLSSEVFPAQREYERTNTTVIDAFITPGVRKYVTELEAYLRGNGFAGALRMVHAAGGVSTCEEVRRHPVALINSGPVAGYIGALKFGSKIGRSNIITADVGGTSFDAGIIVDGHATLRHRTSVPAPRDPSPGYLTGLSMMEVSAIGTGGGSIGWVDTRGMIRVGPRSAGSNPGPACFGLGGTEPTLTDACVVLRLLDPGNFLGGEQRLDPDAAVAAIRTHLVEPLGLTDEYEAAAAMYRLALADMANNVRRMSVEKGHDPRDFSLLSYGGAGGLFLAPVCALASVPEMIAPENCSVFSAFGALLSDYRRSALMSCHWRQGQDVAIVAEGLAALEAKVIADASDAGFSPQSLTLERAADVRFVNQTSELSVPVRGGAIGDDFLEGMQASFRAEFVRSFGADAFWSNAELEILNLRVTAVRPSSVEVRPPRRAATATKPPILRRVYWPFAMDFADWTVLDRGSITPGTRLTGPTIVESADTTVVIPPACDALADDFGNLIIQIAG